jgi:hypothetical protein
LRENEGWKSQADLTPPPVGRPQEPGLYT